MSKPPEDLDAFAEVDVLRRILGLARWAPSGDNTQPWRFSIAGPMRVLVHGFDTRDHCVYDIDGRPSQLAIGCLVETAAIAAAAEGLRTSAEVLGDAVNTADPVVELVFERDPELRRDPLVDSIEVRAVHRRPYPKTPLLPTHKAELEADLPQGYRLRWLEGTALRRQVALLMFRSARLRLVTPEAYRVHRDIIEWNARYSTDKVPDGALGVAPALLPMMRFAMQSWSRVQFFNRFLAGTWAPRIQLDWLPALGCAGHFVLLADTVPTRVADHVRAGRAVQRFWLGATRLGLMLQPELTPLIFARYAAQGRRFSVRPSALDEARRVETELTRLFGPQTVDHGVFLGRVGYASPPDARSTRRELSQLLQS